MFILPLGIKTACFFSGQAPQAWMPHLAISTTDLGACTCKAFLPAWLVAAEH